MLEAVDEAQIAELRASDEFFWLDVTDPTPAQLEHLGSLFGLHELAVEDSREFGQRPKLDRYGDQVLLVAYGIDDGAPVEVHMHLSGAWMITVRRGVCGCLTEARRRIEIGGAGTEEEAIYHVLDALTDSFFPHIDNLDEEVDTLIDAMLEEPRQGQRHALFDLRRRLVELRRIVGPQRDALSAGTLSIQTLPGLDVDSAHDYFRDVVDHLIRLTELIDGLRDLLGGALDVYLSTVSNRLNEIMKRLTLISVIFLPLTFVTGFFGQNFGWMVDHVDGREEFLLFGGGTVVVVLAAMMWWFRRSGFFEA